MNGLVLQGTAITQLIDVVGSLQTTVLQICSVTFLPNVIKIVKSDKVTAKTIAVHFLSGHNVYFTDNLTQ